MVPGAFEGEACVRHPPPLCWVTDVTCSSSQPSTICPPTICPLVNSYALEASTSSPQCLDCHCSFFFVVVLFIFFKRCLSHRDKSVNMGIYMHGEKRTQILLFAPGCVISLQPCQVLTLQVQQD